MTPAEVAATLRQFNGWRRDFDDKFEQSDPHEVSEAIDAAVEMIERLEAAEKSDAESLAMYRRARDERDALRASLEAAESECREQARLNGMGSEREAALMAKLEAAEKDAALKEEVIDSLAAVVKRLDAQCDAAERERDECNRRRLEAADHFAAQTALMKKKCDALRARIEAMVRQEPVAWARKLGLDVPSFGCVTDLKYRPSNIPESSYIPLYALPGAQTQPAPSVPSVEAAEAMGEKGGPVVEAERIAFEAWMRGHCWNLCAEWTGTQYLSAFEKDGMVDTRAMRTREIWAAWRDRAALAAAPEAKP